MKPVLFTLFGIDLPAYFVMLAVGLVLATWLGSRWVRRIGLNGEVIIDLGLAMTIAGVIGARILHVIADGHFWDYVHACTDPARVSWHISRERCIAQDLGGVWDAVASVCHPREPNCYAWAAFWAGGLTFYGGLLFAALYAVYFLRRERFPFWTAADMAGFTIPLGLAWGRMGCFLGGCCFGEVCRRPWGVRFPAYSPASELHARNRWIHSEALSSLPVHPTQLYESFGSLMIALVAYLIVLPRKRYNGQVFVFFIASYSVVRGLLEVLRADERGGLLGLSTSQLISAVLLVLCVLWGACVPARTTPPSICEQRPDVPCVGSVPFAGGGSRTGPKFGEAGGDGGVDGGFMKLTGRVIVAQTIPLSTTALRPAVGWRVETQLTGSQAPSATTDENGSFGLTEVAFTAGAAVLRATPPDTKTALGMLTVIGQATAAVTVVAASRDALETAAIGAGYIPAVGSAHVLLQLMNPAGTVSGVSLAATDSARGNVAYDDSRVGLTAVGPTGSQGTIVVFNLAAPPGGTTVDLHLQHQGRDAVYRVPVVPDFVTWLPVSPP